MPARKITIAGRELVVDARPDRLDLRDLPYRPAVRNLPPRHPGSDKVAQWLPNYLGFELILDQGHEGACTGFGLAAVVNYLLWANCEGKRGERVSGRMLYHLARFYDEWPGEDYEGSSCRGALKGWHKHGVCAEALWRHDTRASRRFIKPNRRWQDDAVTRPLGVYYRVDHHSVVDLQAAIIETHAVYASARVHNGWDVPPRVKMPKSHADLPVISYQKSDGGGHAFALVGYDEVGFVVQNSWGTGWGCSGFSRLSYEDWIEHGTDAWVMALGVPIAHRLIGQQRKEKQEALRSPRYFVAGRPSGSSTPQYPSLAGWMGGGEDPMPDKPHAWSPEVAYEHTIVTGNHGTLIPRLVDQKDGEAVAHHVACELPLKWFKDATNGIRNGPRRLAIYAHGGLNSEEDSIRRIRVMGPWFKQNKIYPIFMSWKSGGLEAIADIVEDERAKHPQFEDYSGGRPGGDHDASDRLIEMISSEFVVHGLWDQMKKNCAESATGRGGLAVLAECLDKLRSASADKLEVHLIGHSAGSILLGHLLDLTKVDSCTLYAPAADAAFALTHYKAAIEARRLARKSLQLHVLSDDVEQDDCIGPYYKSLLYLVSRALERWHKTGVMGLAIGYEGGATKLCENWHSDAMADVRAWQEFFLGGAAPETIVSNPARGLFIHAERQVITRRRGETDIKSLPPAHGTFDNSIDIASATLATILGLSSASALPVPIEDLDY